MALSKKALWEVQVREFPESCRMSVSAVLDWCGEPIRTADREIRFMSVASALQHPNVVFYGLGDAVTPRGFRFGLDGSQYASIFQ